MRSEDSKDKIIKDYDKIVRFVIKDMNLQYKFDEVYDIGVIGFVNGINNYDKAKGSKFTTFLCDCIKNEIIHYLYYEKRVRRSATKTSLNAVINNIELLDLIPSYQDYDRNLYLEEISSIIDRTLGRLKERDEKLFRHLYGIDGYEKLNSIQLEEKFHTSRQNIQRIKVRILNILRKEMQNYYETYQELVSDRNKHDITNVLIDNDKSISEIKKVC